MFPGKVRTVISQYDRGTGDPYRPRYTVHYGTDTGPVPRYAAQHVALYLGCNARCAPAPCEFLGVGVLVFRPKLFAMRVGQIFIDDDIAEGISSVVIIWREGVPHEVNVFVYDDIEVPAE